MNLRSQTSAKAGRLWLLGALLAGALAIPGSPAPPARAQPATPVVATPVIVGAAAGNQGRPQIGGNVLVYLNCGIGDSNPCNIWAMDLTARRPFAVSTSPYGQTLPDTDGTTVVWMDARPRKSVSIGDTANLKNAFDIYAARLSDKKEFLVASGPNLRSRPHVSGNIIVWADFRDTTAVDDPEAGDIYMYDMSTGQTTQVTNDPHAQFQPQTNGKQIVWIDCRNEVAKQNNCDIYGYDIASKQEFRLTSDAAQPTDTAMDGNTVIWGDSRHQDQSHPSDADIYGYDLTTKQEFPIHVGPGTQAYPDVYGNLVVWQQYESPKGQNFYGYDLGTKQEFPIFTGNTLGSSGGIAAGPGLAVWDYTPSDDAGTMNDRRLNLATITGLSTGQGSPTPPLAPPVPGTGAQTFPETQHTVTGLFLDYWKAHGGLAQQGFPISDVSGEKSDLNGHVYTVQYFERAVFEYHPENQAPYNVLLSQLGTFLYKQKYGPAGAPGQQLNTSTGSQFFKETGHRVGGPFLAYWQAHGGLAQQGFPISDEFNEVSTTNGKTYKVQYFERAVFELHPENQAPYHVLLSLLGNFQYKGKYQGGAGTGGNPAPPAPAPAQPTPPGLPTQLAPPPVPPTGTAVPPQPTAAPVGACSNIPASPQASVAPTCGASGTRFVITGTGFRPGEQVGRYYTAPTGTVVPGSSQSTADANGTVTYTFNSTGIAGAQLGVWAGTFEGVDSHNQAIAYFKVTAP